jgi:hypothetical protein
MFRMGHFGQFDLGRHGGDNAARDLFLDREDVFQSALLMFGPEVAAANGNTDTFTGGTAANLAATSMSTGDASPNYSLSAGQIQEYTVTPALPAGSFGIVSVVHHARATAGTSGPTKFDFIVRTGGADFTSPDVAPKLAWGTFAYAWDTNPNTGNAWQTSELLNASASFNLGLKSVASYGVAAVHARANAARGGSAGRGRTGGYRHPADCLQTPTALSADWTSPWRGRGQTGAIRCSAAAG